MTGLVDGCFAWERVHSFLGLELLGDDVVFLVVGILTGRAPTCFIMELRKRWAISLASGHADSGPGDDFRG
jgi:hypothetical protein